MDTNMTMPGLESSPPAKVYGLADDRQRVLRVESDAFPGDFTGWTLLDEGYGDQYVHAQNGYLPGAVLTLEGIPCFALQDGDLGDRLRARTEAEIQADREALPGPGVDPSDLAPRVEALEDKVDGMLTVDDEVFRLLGAD